MVAQVSTATTYQNAINNIMSVKGNIDRLSAQISSGVMADNYIDLYKNQGNIENYLYSSQQLQSYSDYKKSNEHVLNILTVTDEAISAIQDIAASMQNSLTTRRSIGGRSMQLASLVKNNFMPIIQDSLNTNFQGKYIFSGTETNIMPVSDLAMKSNVLNNIPTANYYNGNDAVIKTQATDSTSISYNVTADNQAFQNLIAAANQMIEADQNNDDKLIGKTLDLLSQAISDLASLRANVDNNITALQSINENFGESILNLQKTVSDLNSTDLGTSLIQLMSYNTLIQSTYKVTQMISQMSLVDYMPR